MVMHAVEPQNLDSGESSKYKFNITEEELFGGIYKGLCES